MGAVAYRLLPYALAYALSYLLRSANAVLAEPLAAELHLAPALLGGLTASFYLAFALGQVPLGWLMERRGPRRTLFPLLLVAGLGSFLFALASSPAFLVAGRALMGVGVALALVGSVRAYQLHAPAHLASLSAFTVALGGLGGLMATVPLALLGERLGWRGAFVVLALASWGLGLLGLAVGPSDPQVGLRASQPEGARVPRGALGMGVVAFAYIGSFFALQSLWAGAFAYHLGLEVLQVSRLLFLLNGASVLGGLLAGLLARYLGVGPALRVGMLVFACGLALWSGGLLLPVGYAMVGLGGGFNGLVLAHTASLAGPGAGGVLGLVNLAGVVGIFLVQGGLGVVVERLGYGPAFLALLTLQVLAAAALLRQRQRASRP